MKSYQFLLNNNKYFLNRLEMQLIILCLPILGEELIKYQTIFFYKRTKPSIKNQVLIMAETTI